MLVESSEEESEDSEPTSVTRGKRINGDGKRKMTKKKKSILGKRCKPDSVGGGDGYSASGRRLLSKSQVSSSDCEDDANEEEEEEGLQSGSGGEEDEISESN